MHEHHEFAERDIETSIVSRFERQVDAFPDRVALKAFDELLTYSDLDKASNRVANAVLRRCLAIARSPLSYWSSQAPPPLSSCWEC